MNIKIKRKSAVYKAALLSALCCFQLGYTSSGSHHSHGGSTPKYIVENRVITGQSPFPCPPPVIDPDSFPYPNTEVDTAIVVGRNQVTSKYPVIAIGYQQDRYSSAGGASADYMSVSVDGGKTYKQVPWPTVQCFGAIYERDTDPHMALTSSGYIYTCSIPFNVINDGLANTAVCKYNVAKNKFEYVHYFYDPPTDLYNPPFITTEFPSIVADPQDPCGNTLYVSWTLLTYPDLGDNSQAVQFFSRTTDGVNWTPPSKIYEFPQSVLDLYGPDSGIGLWGFELINNPGKPYSTILGLFVLDVNSDLGPPPFIQKDFPYSILSYDQGRTWTNPIPVNNANSTVQGQVVDPSHLDGVVRAGGGASAVDRDRNIIYLINDEHSLVYDGIPTQCILYVSTDGAASWKPVGPVNTDLSAQAFTPAMCVIDEGKIAISYYDFRNYTGDPNGELQTDRWMDIYYYDIATNSLTLETELRLTEQSFNFRNAPELSGNEFATQPGLYVGDFAGQTFFERKIYNAYNVVPQNSGPNSANVQLSTVTVVYPIPGNQ